MPQPYHPWLCTLDYVRQHRRLDDAETVDDELLKSFIIDTSAEVIESGLDRVPMPYLATLLFDESHRVNRYDLDLRADLLAVTTVVNGDTIGITSGYALRPDSIYPKRLIELATVDDGYWYYPYRESRVSISGWWGYVPHYLTTAWQDSGVDLPSGGLALGATTLTLASGQGSVFEVGQYLRITTDSVAEILQVLDVTAGESDDTLSLARGQLGTEPASHAVGEPLYQFHPLPDIRSAVRELVIWKYKTKDQIGDRVQVIADGVVTVQEVSPQVQRTIHRHRYQSMPGKV